MTNLTDSDAGLGISINNTSGIVLLSNDHHRRIVGRTADGVLGRNWREWVFPTDMSVMNERAERCHAGEQFEYERFIPRPDGSCVLTRVHLFSTMLSGQLVSVATHHTTKIITPADLASALSTAEYVQALCRELETMSYRAGMLVLGSNLSQVASQAGEMSEKLRSASATV